MKRRGEEKNKSIIFDLDGTLADTSIDIYLSVKETLYSFGISPPSYEVVKSYVGDGVFPLIKKIVGDEERAKVIVEKFVKHYEENISKNTYPYDGIVEVLEILCEKYSLIVLTNKMERLAKKLLYEIGLSDFFSLVIGGDTYDFKKPDPRIYVKILENGFFPVAIVGDGVRDAEFSQTVGIEFLLAMWGFISDEVLSFPHKKLFSPKDIIKFLY